MRYRLRTLLILLGVLPPAIAGTAAFMTTRNGRGLLLYLLIVAFLDAVVGSIGGLMPLQRGWFNAAAILGSNFMAFLSTSALMIGLAVIDGQGFVSGIGWAVTYGIANFGLSTWSGVICAMIQWYRIRSQSEKEIYF
jgi:hypothetical protein